MIYLMILIAVAMASYYRGWCKGFDESDKQTEYWFQQSQEYLRLWMDAIKDDEPDDEDGVEIPREEVVVEPVKAMAKAATNSI